MNPPHTLYVKQMQLGHMDNFVYLLGDTGGNGAVVVDPAWNVGEILNQLEFHNAALQAVWLTHGHYDHTDGVTELAQAAGVPVYLPRLTPAEWRRDEWRDADISLIEFDDGDELSVGALTFRVLATPGHSPDGSCFLHRNHLFTGDTLFIDGCGRCDLPASDVEAMYHSLHDVIIPLPDNTLIYPGHDYGRLTVDTLGNQKRTNPFLNAESKKQFVQRRMG
ncbi:MAG: MBL fold metallo-hydrolase [Caldilineaceae bacterium]|nr:MBL fold metallo-hydrolase [Caldilineaceae bacterium]